MIFAANWKMNGNIKFLNSILAEIKQDIIPYIADNSKIIICPPSVYLSQAKLICHNTSIEIGAQDCSSKRMELSQVRLVLTCYPMWDRSG